MEAANYTITKEEYLKMLAREMLETEADPATLKDRLKKLGLTDAEIKAIMDDIEAQRQAMQDELYNGINAASKEELKMRPQPHNEKYKAMVAARK